MILNKFIFIYLFIYNYVYMNMLCTMNIINIIINIYVTVAPRTRVRRKIFRCIRWNRCGNRRNAPWTCSSLRSVCGSCFSWQRNDGWSRVTPCSLLLPSTSWSCRRWPRRGFQNRSALLWSPCTREQRTYSRRPRTVDRKCRPKMYKKI